MHKIAYILGTVCLFSALFCNRGKEEQSPREKEIILSDTVCTPVERRTWQRISGALDSLSLKYRSVFDSAAGKARIHGLRRFARQQDSLCVTRGLAGGYSTYDSLSRHVARYCNEFRFKPRPETTSQRLEK